MQGMASYCIQTHHLKAHPAFPHVSQSCGFNGMGMWVHATTPQWLLFLDLGHVLLLLVRDHRC